MAGSKVRGIGLPIRATTLSMALRQAPRNLSLAEFSKRHYVGSYVLQGSGDSGAAATV